MASNSTQNQPAEESPQLGDIKQADPRTPWLMIICYGVLIFFDGGVMCLFSSWGPYYFSDIVKIKTSVLAFMTAIIVATYAFSQPLAGIISDRTGDRRACFMTGKRRPFLAFGSLAAAIGVVMSFNPPSSFIETVDHGPGVICYFVTAGSTCMGGVGVFEIMAVALLPVIAKNNRQRKELATVSGLSYAMGFASVSLLRAAWGTNIDNGASSAMDRDIQRATFSGLGFFFGIGLLLTTMLFLAQTSEPPTSKMNVQVSRCWCCEIRSFFTWPSFLYWVFYLLATASTAVYVTSMPFFAKFVLNSESAFLWAPVIASCGPFLAAPIWIYLMLKCDKKAVLCASLVSMCFACSVAIFATKGEEGTSVLLVLVGFFSVGIGGYMCAPQSIQPDVCDYDELRSQRRRDGQLLGFWFFSGRLFLALVMGAVLSAWAATGFDASLDKQPSAAKETIRYIAFAVPAIGYLCAAVVMKIYPISQTVLQQVQDGIASCKDGKGIKDPLSKNREITWTLSRCGETETGNTPSSTLKL